MALSDYHAVAHRVPKGTAEACVNCVSLSPDQKHCHNHYFQRANGDRARLPAPADQFVCEWFKKKEGETK